MAHIERLRLYPVKGLDGIDVDTVRITDAGTLAGDREFAMCDPEAEAVETGADMQTLAYNGKQTDRIHDVRTTFDPETATLTVEPKTGGERRAFDLSTEAGRADAGAWFGDFVGDPVEFRRHEPPAFVDRPDAGPSIISTATLSEVASWFEGMSVEGARRRLRANVEVDGVPAFWEDRFVGADAPEFVVGEGDGAVRFEGAEPCARCVVPSRDPETGDPLPAFRERFVERREATFPEWADRDAFDHLYTVMLISRVPEVSRERAISVGDDVTVRTTAGNSKGSV
ncbi:MOSC domain-containing protein [Haloplanus rubicundus]|uniref:MOSC domain-containing protein n=1 Tax=Haloplanus rubicundus TaxID=1547898 RepID=A0A345EGU7_9EURY|nr:MOSC N-terminal beta barrel domain-containing protein [Haloplanus rubicundus]AXG11419.1 MOSC domain-containing protein [Haloplanus rubicundus]